MTRGRDRSAAAILAVVLAFAAGLLLADAPRLWGFDHLRDLPPAVGAAAAAGALLLVAALATTAGHRTLNRASSAWGALVAGPGDPAWRRRIGDCALPAALTLLCWLVRSKYALLGDNWLRLDQAVRGQLLPYEWGTMALLHGAVRAGDAWLGLMPCDAIALVNTLAALPFGLAAAALARRLGGDAAARGWVHLSLLGLGGVQLFCGYVEAYSWAFACLMLYLAALAAVQEGTTRTWLGAVLCFAAGVALHAVVLLFGLPLLLLLSRLRRTPSGAGVDPNHTRPSTAARAAIVLLFAGALALPLLAPRLIHDHATLAAPGLWWERAQALLLASPMGALLGLPLLLTAAVQILRDRPPRPDFRTLLFLAAALPAVVVLAMMKAVLGSADWDIFAFAGPPLVLWATRALHDARLRWLAAGLVVVSLANTWSFVAVNASQASVARIQRILTNDPAPYYAGHPAPLHLAFLFQANGLTREMFASLEEAVRQHPEDPRMAHNLASACFQHGDLEQAGHWARASMMTRPGYVPPIHLLFRIAERSGNVEELATLGNLLLELHAQQPELVTPYIKPGELARIRERIGRDP